MRQLQILSYSLTLTLLLSAGAPRALAEDPCASFQWDVSKERALFGSPAQTQASQAQYGSNGQVQEMEASISPAGTETQQMVAPMVVPATTAQTASVVPPVYPVNATQPSACAVSTVQSSNGPKLKFIVNE